MLLVRWLIWCASSVKILGLHVLRVRLLCDLVPLWDVWCGLLLVVGFLGRFVLPFVMSINCMKALIMSLNLS